MKRLFTFLLIVMCSLACTAQGRGQFLIVYDVSDNVTNVRKKQLVEKSQHLSLKDQIIIPEDGYIKLFDKDKQRMFTLKDKC